MSFWEMLIIAIGLAMDAFAAAALKGLAVKHLRPGHCFLVGAYFGLFQAAMPIAGFILGSRFSGVISGVDHWISFFLLAFIGAKMIADPDLPGETDAAFSPRALLPLALATSADALAAGISFAFLNVPILSAALLIGAVAFLLSAAGVWTGALTGSRVHASASRGGGMLLLAMGSKLLISHLI